MQALLLGCAGLAMAASPIPERVDNLMAQMNLAEKVSMLAAAHTPDVQQYNMTGVGTAKYETCITGKTVEEMINNRNALQKQIVEGSRLHIPITFVNEGLHGGAPNGTVFPMPINQGAAWNKTLVADIATRIADQASTIGVQVVFAPVVNMMTDPRFGRGQEGYGEDPCLTAHLGKAAVQALQGPTGCDGADTYMDSTHHVASLAKHFAAYGAAAGGLNGGPADITNRSLHDMYLKPWRALTSVGVRASMASHNTVNDVPAHGNRWLLYDSYRRSLGFGDGVIMSDCNDLGVLEDFQVAVNSTHAAAIGVHSTVDLDLQCGTADQWTYPHLPDALASGLLSEDDLNAAVRRVLYLKFATGWDTPYTVVNSTRIAALDGPENRKLAREAASESITLLQNSNNLLPLNLSSITKLALIGPSQGKPVMEAVAMTGSYTLAPLPPTVTVQEGLTNAGFTGKVLTSVGGAATGLPDNQADLIPAAVEIAKEADVVVLVLGDLDGGCGEWNDRDNLDMQGSQVALMQAVTAVNKNVVTVLIHGRPQTFGLGNAVLQNTSALLSAMRPGSEGGNAIWDVLTGKVNPSGKLSQSWPRTVGQVHGGASPFMQRIRGKWVGNKRGRPDSDGRYYDGYVSDGWESTPLFYFGFGLSYTTFAYHSVGFSSAQVLSVTVQNTGAYAGSEVIQVYVQDPPGTPFVKYWKRLLAFEKVFFKPGETKTVSIPFTDDDLMLHDENMDLKVLPGTYTITIGGSSQITPLNTTYHV